MSNRIVDKEITLVRYYPNYKTALAWYQDLELCRQVDNRDTVYDLPLLKGMYKYLDRHGDLFYIKYKNRLCGDVCLQPDGEINIVIAKPFQNRHIGRRVIGEIINLAKKKEHSATACADLHLQHTVAANVPKSRLYKSGCYALYAAAVRMETKASLYTRKPWAQPRRNKTKPTYVSQVGF